ncbi:MAG TPA: FAD-dependent oxidoreductase [Acidimicrobiales bacterium]|jgi:choline dehydrogenase-like flavoprotein|nr:FAD-dependent oxidoreductase [Acidimicrobiales bacterium]
MKIEDIGAISNDLSFTSQVVVVGAGPAGIVMALELSNHGFDVVLIESGKRKFDAGLQELSAAAHWDRDLHAPLPLAVRRQIGGTSSIWGGRCVPYDPIDFRERPYVETSPWPVTYEEMRAYFQRACDWFVCGRPIFNAAQIPNLPKSIVPGLVDGGVTASDLERWSLPTDFGTTYAKDLENRPRLRIFSGVTATKILCKEESDTAEGIEGRTLGGGKVVFTAARVVIACGGLESTRLLLDSPGPRGGALGGESGHLGKWYMAHLEGTLAKVQFVTDPKLTIFGYERDIDGTYIRRRFGFTEEFQLKYRLPNITGWITNPELADASHSSGELSFAYLALASKLGPMFAPDAQRLSLTGVNIPGTPYGHSPISSKKEHVKNLAKNFIPTAKFMASFGARRLLARKRRMPGFFVRSEDNVYPLQYHGEHLPNAESCVSLSREQDQLGRRKLDIRLRFTEQDIDGVVRAHRHWDDHFRSLGIGRLIYPNGDPFEIVKDRSGGGFHQIGTTRMAENPSDGVVDGNLAVHGVKNLHVVSSSTFVTSGQANSTFMIVAFAVRLADHLRGLPR